MPLSKKLKILILILLMISITYSQTSTNCQSKLELYRGAITRVKGILEKSSREIKTLRQITNLQENIIQKQDVQISNYILYTINLTNLLAEQEALHKVHIEQEKLKQVPLPIRIAETSGAAVLFLVLGILVASGN